MPSHEKVLIPLTPPPVRGHSGSSGSNHIGSSGNLRNLFGILMALCLFIVYVYWSSSTTAAATVPGEFSMFR